MSSLQIKQFSELYDSPSRNGIYKSKEFHGSGYKIVNMGEMFAFNFIGNQPMNRVNLNESEIRTSELKEGDLLFGRRSLVEAGAGKCTLVVSLNERLTFESSIIRVRLNKDIANPRYLYYYFLSPNGRLKIRAIVSGTNVKGIRGSDLAKINIALPGIDKQNWIVEILIKYDLLIENNEKRLSVLEESAKTLYIEWFEKFKFSENKNIKMIDSTLGRIPSGWKIVPLSDLANFINGYPFKPSDLQKNGLPIIKIPELRSGILDKTPRNSGDNIPKKYLVENGDILFSWSATLLVNIWNSGTALLNQHLFKVTPKQEVFKSYVYYLLKHQVEKLSSHTVGSTMQHLRRGTIVDAKVLLPPLSLIERYENFASQLKNESRIIQLQNQNLERMRELLTIQLISGKKYSKN